MTGMAVVAMLVMMMTSMGMITVILEVALIVVM